MSAVNQNRRIILKRSRCAIGYDDLTFLQQVLNFEALTKN